MSKFSVYVDESGNLCTQTGSVLRKATASECESATATEEGYIECPKDVVNRLCIDSDDGTTRLIGSLA